MYCFGAINAYMQFTDQFSWRVDLCAVTSALKEQQTFYLGSRYIPLWAVQRAFRWKTV